MGNLNYHQIHHQHRTWDSDLEMWTMDLKM